MRLRAPATSILFFLLALCSAHSGALEHECDASIMESKAQSFSLLNAEQDHRDHPGCIVFAIYGLETTKDPRTLALLLKYLDFKRPPEDRVVRRAFITTAYLYPAVDALSSAGRFAVPALVNFISVDQANELTRHNALVAFLEIYRTDKAAAIARLKEEAGKRTDGVQYVRLMDAAREASQDCFDKVPCTTK